MKLLFICTCVFLIYDILEYVYHSACDKKFSVQLDPYLVQRKYIFLICISKLITTQSSSPYKVVLVSTSMVIVIVLLVAGGGRLDAGARESRAAAPGVVHPAGRARALRRQLQAGVCRGLDGAQRVVCVEAPRRP